jgi:hypothetical protein
MIKLLTVYDSFDVPGKGQVIVGRSEDKAVPMGSATTLKRSA